MNYILPLEVKMKYFKLFSLLLVIILLMSCSTIYVVYDYDVEADFTKYSTYKWDMNKSDSAFKNQLLDKRLRHALNKELQTRGFEQSDDNADFILTYEQATHQEKDVYVVHSNHGWPRHRFHTRQIFVDRHKEGTIVLNIFDGKTEELVWQGWASGIEVDLENIEYNINTTAAKLIEKFPPAK
jgi:Domain of unknown function (DUF4136)